jgi:Holliday junction resolvase RusA-like endonuclease
LTICLTILGEPASKANSRELVTFGSGENKRPALIKSQKARDYERDALRQIPPMLRIQIEVPVRVTMRIFYASERPDLDASVVLDCLQDRWHGKGEARALVQKGVIRNDRQVRELHLYHAIDRTNPRAEIEIQTLAPAQQAMPLPEPELAGEPF